MTYLRKAAEQALEALGSDSISFKLEARVALRKALESEWVCCVCGEPKALGVVHSADSPCFHYTKREWVGLTEEEKYDVLEGATGDGGRVYYDTLFQSYEAKLKEKNT